MATASTYGTYGGVSRQITRCRNNKKEKTQICTPVFNGYGFLKHRFQPLMGKACKELKSTYKIEHSFFCSLTNLAQLYAFQPLDVKGRLFPYNMLLAYNHAVAKVNKVNPHLHLMIVQDKPNTVCLTTVQPMDTGMTLYYLPVRPVWELLQDREQQQSAELLLSVYAYCYQVAGIPYYRDSSCSMFYTYEIMEEWVRDNDADWDQEDYAEQVAAFKRITHYGDVIKRKINNACHLRQWASRVNSYTPTSEEETKLHTISRQFLQLYCDFPQRSIMDKIYNGLIAPQKEERIYPDQYISFYWDYADCLYKSLYELINTELQEKEAMEEPLIIQAFDLPQEKIASTHLAFEERFFTLINELNAWL